MKKIIYPAVLIAVQAFGIMKASAQTPYSYSVAEILGAGASGLTLADGTIVTATKIKTGSGVYGTTAGDAHGEAGPDIGGLFNGTVLPGYTGPTDSTKFTKLVMDPSSSVDNGIGTNYASSVGFHIHFSRPVANPEFLVLDIDGYVLAAGSSTNGNSEWATAFGYNGNTFVPMTGTYYVSPPAPATEITTGSATIGSGHAWNTMKSTEIPGADALPATYTVWRQNATNDGDADPDNIQNQVLFTSTSSITDFFVMTGIYRSVSTTGFAQRSGVSPIRIVVTPDFGDAPDSYGTLLNNNGASHGISSNLKLGATETTEADGTPSAGANSATDDDGIATVPSIINSGSVPQVVSSYSLTTSYTNNTIKTANIIGWIDWNNNGTFEAGEAKATSVAAATSGSITLTWTGVTLSGLSGDAATYARIRITTDSMTTANPTGAFKDGEVEDYLVPFSVPLPVTLTHFDAASQGNNVLVSWGTAAENCAAFMLQHSADGHNFSNTATIAARGDNSNYTYTDEQVAPGNHLYRLKITDRDGSIQYGPVKNLIVAGDIMTASIYPNPCAGGIVTILLQGDSGTGSSFELTDITGSLLQQGYLQSNTGNTIDISKIAAGLYLLKIRVNGTSHIQQLSIIR